VKGGMDHDNRSCNLMAAENAPSRYPPHSVSDGGWHHPPAISKHALKSEFHLCR
jgi:hypothetical protein